MVSVTSRNVHAMQGRTFRHLLINMQVNTVTIFLVAVILVAANAESDSEDEETLTTVAPWDLDYDSLIPGDHETANEAVSRKARSIESKEAKTKDDDDDDDTEDDGYFETDENGWTSYYEKEETARDASADDTNKEGGSIVNRERRSITNDEDNDNGKARQSHLSRGKTDKESINDVKQRRNADKPPDDPETIVGKDLDKIMKSMEEKTVSLKNERRADTELTHNVTDNEKHIRDVIDHIMGSPDKATKTDENKMSTKDVIDNKPHQSNENHPSKIIHSAQGRGHKADKGQIKMEDSHREKTVTSSSKDQRTTGVVLDEKEGNEAFLKEAGQKTATDMEIHAKQAAMMLRKRIVKTEINSQQKLKAGNTFPGPETHKQIVHPKINEMVSRELPNSFASTIESKNEYKNPTSIAPKSLLRERRDLNEDEEDDDGWHDNDKPGTGFDDKENMDGQINEGEGIKNQDEDTIGLKEINQAGQGSLRDGDGDEWDEDNFLADVNNTLNRNISIAIDQAFLPGIHDEDTDLTKSLMKLGDELQGFKMLSDEDKKNNKSPKKELTSQTVSSLMEKQVKKTKETEVLQARAKPRLANLSNNKSTSSQKSKLRLGKKLLAALKAKKASHQKALNKEQGKGAKVNPTAEENNAKSNKTKGKSSRRKMIKRKRRLRKLRRKAKLNKRKRWLRRKKLKLRNRLLAAFKTNGNKKSKGKQAKDNSKAKKNRARGNGMRKKLLRQKMLNKKKRLNRLTRKVKRLLRERKNRKMRAMKAKQNNRRSKITDKMQLRKRNLERKKRRKNRRRNLRRNKKVKKGVMTRGKRTRNRRFLGKKDHIEAGSFSVTKPNYHGREWNNGGDDVGMRNRLQQNRRGSEKASRVRRDSEITEEGDLPTAGSGNEDDDINDVTSISGDNQDAVEADSFPKERDMIKDSVGLEDEEPSPLSTKRSRRNDAFGGLDNPDLVNKEGINSEEDSIEEDLETSSPPAHRRIARDVSYEKGDDVGKNKKLEKDSAQKDTKPVTSNNSENKMKSDTNVKEGVQKGKKKSRVDDAIEQESSFDSPDEEVLDQLKEYKAMPEAVNNVAPKDLDDDIDDELTDVFSDPEKTTEVDLGERNLESGKRERRNASPDDSEERDLGEKPQKSADLLDTVESDMASSGEDASGEGEEDSEEESGEGEEDSEEESGEEEEGEAKP